jgi:hypothetical protein
MTIDEILNDIRENARNPAHNGSTIEKKCGGVVQSLLVMGLFQSILVAATG